MTIRFVSEDELKAMIDEIVSDYLLEDISMMVVDQFFKRHWEVVVDDELQVDDRIQLLSMPEDPDPIPIGSIGTVYSVTPFGSRTMIGVNWDNGRTLTLCVPPDIYRKI